NSSRQEAGQIFRAGRFVLKVAIAVFAAPGGRGPSQAPKTLTSMGTRAVIDRPYSFSTIRYYATWGTGRAYFLTDPYLEERSQPSIQTGLASSLCCIGAIHRNCFRTRNKNHPAQEQLRSSRRRKIGQRGSRSGF